MWPISLKFCAVVLMVSGLSGFMFTPDDDGTVPADPVESAVASVMALYIREMMYTQHHSV